VSGATAQRPMWTGVGQAMGYTDSEDLRAAILAAADAITWSELPDGLTHLRGPAARALIAAVFRGRRDQIRRTGTATVAATGKSARPQRLIGIEDHAGVRYFVLDLGHEAVYLLRSTANPSAAAHTP